MPLNLSNLPVDGRSAEAIATHTQMYKESLDTFCVYNPTDTDYVVHFDAKNSNEREGIPNKNKDIGHGKGMAHIPRYMMRLYADHLGQELVNQKIHEDWESKKNNYRQEERGIMEERLALKQNDPKLWKDVMKLLVKGIVKRFGGDDVYEEMPETKPENRNLSSAMAALEELGLTDRDMDLESAKDQLAQDLL